MVGALAVAVPGCIAGPATTVGEDTQALGTPPGSALEWVFPQEYSDVQIGRGIRTVTSTRTASSCIELPDGVGYEVSARDWLSEGSVVANQTEFAKKFNLDANLAIAHGAANASLGLQAMRELDWKSASLKLVIRAVYSYDVVLKKPDDARLTQAAYDLIKPPAAGDTQALRDARARAFLKTCGRYWAKGVRKGAEVVIVYSLNHTKIADRTTLNTTATASVPATTTAGGSVKYEQQQAFKNAIQGASLKVYARGIKVVAGDPVAALGLALDPAATNQLEKLSGFFTDMKQSLNDNHAADSAPMATPISSNVDARKIAMIGQYYQPLFRDPLPAGPLAEWAGRAQTDLFNQDNALYTTIDQYTTFLAAARAAEKFASFVRNMAVTGRWNFPTNPELDIPAVGARMDRLRETVRVAENGIGPLERGLNGGLPTDAQETGYWARRCWDLVVQGNESVPCFQAADFYTRAQAALTAFNSGLPKPLNFFTVYYVRDFGVWGGPQKSEGEWMWADRVCKKHVNTRLDPLNLKLPTDKEIDAFGPFMSDTPSHQEGTPGMGFSDNFLWEATPFKAWEWNRTGWVSWAYTGKRGSNPDHPWACIRPAGPFAMPAIIFN